MVKVTVGQFNLEELYLFIYCIIYLLEGSRQVSSLRTFETANIVFTSLIYITFIFPAMKFGGYNQIKMVTKDRNSQLILFSIRLPAYLSPHNFN